MNGLEASDDDDILSEHLNELKEEDSRKFTSSLSFFYRAQVSKPLHSFNRMSESISFQSDLLGLIA